MSQRCLALRGTGTRAPCSPPWSPLDHVPDMLGDHDGDGRADMTVYRPATSHWFVLWSSSGYAAQRTYEW